MPNTAQRQRGHTGLWRGGGAILGLSLSNVLQGKFPLLGVQGRRLSSEPQIMSEWPCLNGKLQVVMADQMGWADRGKLECWLRSGIQMELWKTQSVSKVGGSS